MQGIAAPRPRFEPASLRHTTRPLVSAPDRCLFAGQPVAVPELLPRVVRSAGLSAVRHQRSRRSSTARRRRVRFVSPADLRANLSWGHTPPFSSSPPLPHPFPFPPASFTSSYPIFTSPLPSHSSPFVFPLPLLFLPIPSYAPYVLYPPFSPSMGSGREV